METTSKRVYEDEHNAEIRIEFNVAQKSSHVPKYPDGKIDPANEQGCEQVQLIVTDQCERCNQRRERYYRVGLIDPRVSQYC